MYVFGSGTIWATPTHDADGVVIANPQPVMIGTVQESSIEFKGELKKLYGQKKYPVDAADSKNSIEGSIKHAEFSADAFNSVFFGATVGTSGKVARAATSGAVIPTTGSQVITPEVPGSGTYDSDLGVIYVSNGKPLKRVETTPGEGEYSVSSGTYTFSDDDAGKSVYINFMYTRTGLKVIKGTNGMMGAVPKFSLVLQQMRGGEQMTLTLKACVSSSLKFAFKNEDFAIPEMAFEAVANDAGEVFEWAQG